jgi:hypothetical protein
MQLVTFEEMLKTRLEASGGVRSVKTYMEVASPEWYGLVVEVDGGTVPVRLTRGSGTGDPPMSGAEQAAHDANIARGVKGNKPQLRHGAQQVQAVEVLIREVLAADPPLASTLVEGRVDGRELPGVRVRFETGLEIYAKPE